MVARTAGGASAEATIEFVGPEQVGRVLILPDDQVISSSKTATVLALFGAAGGAPILGGHCDWLVEDGPGIVWGAGPIDDLAGALVSGDQVSLRAPPRATVRAACLVGGIERGMAIIHVT